MSKFLNYLNPFTQSNKIYSEADLMSMSIKDILNNKEEIIAQKGIIGIPKQAELSSSQNAVYVNGYTKSDGTVVKPHWRSRSGGGVNSQTQGASCGAVQDGISQTAQNISGKSTQPQDFVTAALPVQNSQTQSAPINANDIDGSTWNVLENTTPDFGNTNTYQTITNEPDYSNMSEEDIILNTAKVVQHSLLNNPYAKSRFSEREWNAIENLINCDGKLDVWMMKELDPYESRIKRIDEFDSPDVVKDILKYCVKRPTLDEMNKKINDFIDWSKQFKNKPVNTNSQNISGSVSDMHNISDYSNIQGSPTGFAAPVQNSSDAVTRQKYYNVKPKADKQGNIQFVASKETLNNDYSEAIKKLDYIVSNPSLLNKLGGETGKFLSYNLVKYYNLAKPRAGLDFPPIKNDYNSEYIKPARVSRWYNPIVDSFSIKKNFDKNKSRPDALQMFDIAIYGLNSYDDNHQFVHISDTYTSNINKLFNLSESNKIEENMQGLLFNKQSGFANRISNSDEFQTQVMCCYDKNTGRFNTDKILVNFTKDKNLNYSVGHGTVMNPKVTKDGYFEGILFDKYDFTLLIKAYKGDYSGTLANNYAAIAHLIKNVEYYYFLVPVRFKLPK